MKKIIIETLVASEKTAIIEDDKLVELLIDEAEDNKLVSNIYRGIVMVRWLPERKSLPVIQLSSTDVSSNLIVVWVHWKQWRMVQKTVISRVVPMTLRNWCRKVSLPVYLIRELYTK